MEENITISRKLLQKLVSNFYEACALCDECDIYEHTELDESMQEMKEWANVTFGRKVNKENYL